MHSTFSLEHKNQHLGKILRDLNKVMVAFSGGVDSSLLLKRAIQELGKKVTAVVVASESFPEWEYQPALRLAKSLGVKVIETEVKDFENQKLINNPINRCYYCKSDFFSHLTGLASKMNIRFVLDGTNFDDLSDTRPGIQAKEEQGVISPLAITKMTKQNIRMLSKQLGLSNWDKPSFACLNSRIPYGSKITLKKIQQIDQAELFLKKLGFIQCRVRHHDEIARIEILPDEFQALMDKKKQITEKLLELGFKFIALDLKGYRTGSMNGG